MMKTGDKIMNIAMAILIIFMLGAAGYCCKSCLDEERVTQSETEKINACHKLLEIVTDQYDFSRLRTEDFAAAHACFFENRMYCNDYKKDGMGFSRKLFIISDFKSKFETLKNSSQIEQELFLIKMNRVMMTSTESCYKGTCKHLGKSFICSE